jgi:hypothetical protein
MTRVGRTTTAIQPTSTGLTKVDSARDIVLVRSKIRNNSANTPKRGLNLYRLNSAKNTTTIRPVTDNDNSPRGRTDSLPRDSSIDNRIHPTPEDSRPCTFDASIASDARPHLAWKVSKYYTAEFSYEKLQLHLRISKASSDYPQANGVARSFINSIAPVSILSSPTAY